MTSVVALALSLFTHMTKPGFQKTIATVLKDRLWHKYSEITTALEGVQTDEQFLDRARRLLRRRGGDASKASVKLGLEALASEVVNVMIRNLQVEVRYGSGGRVTRLKLIVTPTAHGLLPIPKKSLRPGELRIAEGT